MTLSSTICPSHQHQHSHDDVIVPAECKDGGHRNLVGAANQHRHIGFELKEAALTVLPTNDRTEEFDFKWFRFNLEKKATRMLQRNDVSDLIMKEKVCVFLSLFFTTWQVGYQKNLPSLIIISVKAKLIRTTKFNKAFF